MLDLLNSAFFGSAEALVNRLLAADPRLREALAPLSGALLRIECSMPSLNINILFHENGLHLNARGDQGDPDTLIRGSAADLLRLLSGGGVPASLHGSGVDISGDLENAVRLQQALAASRLDWEYHLSKFLGDVPTQMASDAFKAGRDFLGSSRDSLAMNLDDYLHEERRLFPDRREVALFNSLVDKLRLDTDRLEARVRKLSERIEEYKGEQR